MAQRFLTAVEKVLRAYAERGSFRGFESRSRGSGRLEARVGWLAPSAFQLNVEERSRSLVWKNVLPGIAPGSDLDAELREFVASLAARGRPAHRRFDASRWALRVVNRGGDVSLGLRVLGQSPRSAAEGARRAVKLLHEVWFVFLSLRHPEYLVEHFDAPEE